MPSVEQWRPVPSFEGRYVVSDQGRVCNVRTGRILKPWANDAGYSYVELWSGRPAKARVHRLVLLAFEGPCPSGMEACHADGDRANNVRTNLRWDTPSSNASDRVTHGTAGYTATRCGNGHAYSVENAATQTTRGTQVRRCRECNRERMRRRRAADPMAYRTDRVAS